MRINKAIKAYDRAVIRYLKENNIYNDFIENFNKNFNGKKKTTYKEFHLFIVYYMRHCSYWNHVWSVRYEIYKKITKFNNSDIFDFDYNDCVDFANKKIYKSIKVKHSWLSKIYNFFKKNKKNNLYEFF